MRDVSDPGAGFAAKLDSSDQFGGGRGSGEELAPQRGRIDTLSPQADIVSIPWREGHAIEGCFVASGAPASDDVPVILCVGESRLSKEQLLAAFAQSAHESGMSLLGIDLPAPIRSLEAEPPATPETAIVAAIDYLHERAGVDAERIAVVADGSPSSMVARGVALDGRVAAAVCDAGVWQLWEHDQICGLEAAGSIEPLAVRALRCPTLMLIRSNDGIDPEHVRQLLARSGTRDVDLREFAPSGPDRTEPLASAAEIVVQWLTEQLQGRAPASPV